MKRQIVFGAIVLACFTFALAVLAEQDPSQATNLAVTYIAQQAGIDPSELIIVNDHPTYYPYLDRTFQAVVLLDTRPDGKFYSVLVDLADGHIETDLAALQAAEEKAYLTRYGKLQLSLYTRLQDVGDAERLPVAIWVVGEARQSQAEIFAAVAAQFPEAQAAQAHSGKLWDVSNPDLATRIKAVYSQMQIAETSLRIAPLVTYLEDQGLEVTTYGSLPSVTAEMNKAQILAAAQRPDVGMVYLIEAEAETEMDVAIPTDLVPPVWNRGFDGSGVTIAVLENSEIDPDVSCLDVIDVRPVLLLPVSEHKTLVSSVATCDDVTYRGVAYGAQLLDAAFSGTQSDGIDAMRWAVESPYQANVVNASFGWEEDNNVNWGDRAFDYWARQQLVFIVKSAGNSGGSISSPGKAWNVLTVGGTNDNGTVGWRDDTMYNLSGYINPTSPFGQREKPEVVAPAVDIMTIGLGGVPTFDNGTSLASPQVAGLAALLIDRHDSLNIWPEAIRAIIMASATHNIVGPTGIPTGQDLQDGAGAINAVYADNIAQFRNTSDTDPCEVSCWWGAQTDNVPVGEYFYRYFNATAGQPVRVAISWWSQADSPGNDYSFDRLDTNFDLLVEYFNGSFWEPVPGAYSASLDNNYELVEFTAVQSGAYRIAVYKREVFNNEVNNYVGIALLKLNQVYLPVIIE